MLDDMLVPLYLQIKEQLLKSLDDAEWKPGESIPSENVLALRYGVSQGTVRKAIDDLVVNKILVRRQGSGTFVATHAERQVSRMFLKVFADDNPNQKQWFLSRRYLSCELLTPDAKTSAVLHLLPQEKAYLINRQLCTKDQVIVQDYIWLPKIDSKQQLSFDYLLAKQEQPLYALLENMFAFRFLRAKEQLKAVAATKDLAKLMDIDSGSPVLQIARVSYTYNDKPIEFRQSYCLTNNHFYSSILN